MKRAFIWFWLLLKRQLKNKAVLFFVIGIPLCVYIMGKIPAMNENGVPKVGLILMDEDEVTVQAAKRLVESHGALEFFYADSEENLVDEIIKGNVECGYVFSKNMKEKLDSRKYKGSIKLIKNSSGMLVSLSNEVVFSEMFKVYAKYIAVDYVNSSDFFSGFRQQAVIQTSAKYDDYLKGAATFHLDYVTVSDTQNGTDFEEIQINDNIFPLRGILAVLVYIAGIFGTVQWKRDYENGIFLTMSNGFRNISRLVYILIPALLFGVSSWTALMISDVNLGFAAEGIKMSAYILYIVCFGIFLTLVFPKSIHIISLIPIFLVGSLIFCPVFIDLGTYIPFVRLLNKFFIPYYYLL